MKKGHVSLGFAQQLEPGAKAIPLVCGHCNDQILVVLPLGIDSLCSLAKWFEGEHSECGGEAAIEDDVVAELVGYAEGYAAGRRSVSEQEIRWADGHGPREESSS